MEEFKKKRKKKENGGGKINLKFADIETDTCLGNGIPTTLSFLSYSVKHVFFIFFYIKKEDTIIKKGLHQPGIEPGSVPWQGTILPLDHWCFLLHKSNIFV